MKVSIKTITAVVLFLAASFLNPSSPKILNGDGKLERFALELRGCQEALAKDKPTKCKLFGKIKIVESFPDIKVKVVESFSDIKVKVVDSFPDKPGKWKIVENFPDYKVKFVDSFPDYKVKFVDSFPGCD